MRHGLSRDEQYEAVEQLLRKTCEDSRVPAVAAIRTMPRFELADTSKLDRPVLCVAVDAEEDFDWDAGFSRNNTSVRSMSHQHLAQGIFTRYGVTPTYLVDYPVATDPAFDQSASKAVSCRSMRDRGATASLGKLTAPMKKLASAILFLQTCRRTCRGESWPPLRK